MLSIFASFQLFSIYFLIFLQTFQYVWTSEDTAAEIKLYTELREQCLRKLNISSPHEQTLTNLACMDRCILEKVGIITADGHFHTENIPENIRNVAIICNEETKHLEGCQRAQSYNLCVFKTVGVKVLAEVCANETSVDLDYQSMPKTMMNMTDESLYCYSRCMLIKLEKLDSNNRINSNLLKIYLNDVDKILTSVKSCEDGNQQEDVCEQAVQRELCILEKLS